MPLFRFVIIVCLVALTACNRAPRFSVYEITGSRSERVAGVSTIIAKHKALPTSIIDAHFVQEQTGDNSLGPADFRAFYSIEIAPQEISQWMKILTPLGATAKFDAPARPRDWWIARETFASLQFYKPDILTGRVHGWIGVSQQTGRIYIFAITM